MANWALPMQQTFEYYKVDPGTWCDTEQVHSVISSTITRDSGAATLGSLSLKTTESIDECYIRVYMVTNQNGIREKHPLGTFLIQSPSIDFNGKYNTVAIDGYTPLIELKENYPPYGYHLLKKENIMDIAYRLVRENARAPVVETESTKTLTNNFIADISDTWLTYITSLIYNADYELGLDELSRIIFSKKQELYALRPKWTYNDDNSSILYPNVSLTQDLYGIPNVVEVIYSNGRECIMTKATNKTKNSPTSTVSRGRTITHRITNPELYGNPTKEQLTEYAEKMLRELSSLECSVTYTHGYCPVRLGDCVRLNYSKAGINNVKAKVIYQSIECKPGCPVTEKAIFTTELWKG